MGCTAPRSPASAAARTWGTCSPTARRMPAACGTASTRSPCSSSRTRPRAARPPAAEERAPERVLRNPPEGLDPPGERDTVASVERSPTRMIDRRRELAVAAGGTVTVLVATALMSPHSGGVVATTTPAMVFLLIVLGTALAGGPIAGFVAAAVAFAAQLYYFVPPDHGIGVEDTRS